MGQRVHVETYDDLDEALEATHNVEFLWKGKVREIDLGEVNYSTYVAFLEPFVKASRLKEESDKAKPKATGTVTAERRAATEERMKIRKWGRRNGWPELGSNGVIPADVIEGFHKYGGKDIPAGERFADPDPVPADVAFADRPAEEQAKIKAWVVDMGLAWPRAKIPRDRIANEAWAETNPVLAKEIVAAYA